MVIALQFSSLASNHRVIIAISTHPSSVTKHHTKETEISKTIHYFSDKSLQCYIGRFSNALQVTPYCLLFKANSCRFISSILWNADLCESLVGNSRRLFLHLLKDFRTPRSKFLSISQKAHPPTNAVAATGCLMKKNKRTAGLNADAYAISYCQ